MIFRVVNRPMKIMITGSQKNGKGTFLRVDGPL